MCRAVLEPFQPSPNAPRDTRRMSCCAGIAFKALMINSLVGWLLFSLNTTIRLLCKKHFNIYLYFSRFLQISVLMSFFSTCKHCGCAGSGAGCACRRAHGSRRATLAVCSCVTAAQLCSAGWGDGCRALSRESTCVSPCCAGILARVWSWVPGECLGELRSHASQSWLFWPRVSGQEKKKKNSGNTFWVSVILPWKCSWGPELGYLFIYLKIAVISSKACLY